LAREQLIDFLPKHHAEALPTRRAEVSLAGNDAGERVMASKTGAMNRMAVAPR
jgi:hypothetical protein